MEIVLFQMCPYNLTRRDDNMPVFFGACFCFILTVSCLALFLQKYLNAALKATGLFHKLAKDGGVKAIFLKEYTWYEEYPTQPSSFVLNGFIFSLLGLYDLAEASRSAGIQSDAESLYKDGLRSLKALAMLYDTGMHPLSLPLPCDVC